jgi:mediator of replication checkpoint protein 1
LTKEEIAAFLENEAAESDEDDNFGFGKAKKDDEEDDGEDLDQTLDILMDDNAMDEGTVAAELVMEKYKYDFQPFTSP